MKKLYRNTTVSNVPENYFYLQNPPHNVSRKKKVEFKNIRLKQCRILVPWDLWHSYRYYTCLAVERLVHIAATVCFLQVVSQTPYEKKRNSSSLRRLQVWQRSIDWLQYHQNAELSLEIQPVSCKYLNQRGNQNSIQTFRATAIIRPYRIKKLKKKSINETFPVVLKIDWSCDVSVIGVSITSKKLLNCWITSNQSVEIENILDSWLINSKLYNSIDFFTNQTYFSSDLSLTRIQVVAFIKELLVRFGETIPVGFQYNLMRS